MTRFALLQQKEAEEIAKWHYDPPFSFYDLQEDPEDLEEFLNPMSRPKFTFAAYDGDVLFGYFVLIPLTETRCELGLGMAPNNTGRGRGETFIHEILSYLQMNFPFEIIDLSVAAFNLRAIKVYQKVGFETIETFMQSTNGGHYEFQRMRYKLSRHTSA